MPVDYGNVQVYLGDGRAAPQRERLIEVLPETVAGLGWREALCDEAERVISIGRADRWLTLLDSLQLDQPEEHDCFCAALSRHFPLVSLRWWAASSGEQGALGLALYRDGALRDRLAKGAGAKEGAPGNPALWADLLGSRRNSARLEIAWGGAASAAAMLDATAEIVGFDRQLCRRGEVDEQLVALEELCTQLDGGALAGWTGIGLMRR